VWNNEWVAGGDGWTWVGWQGWDTILFVTGVFEIPIIFIFLQIWVGIFVLVLLLDQQILENIVVP